MEDVLRRSLTSSIELKLALSAGLWMTHCDPGQLENVMLNLVTNARDAMPDGGTLLIESSNVGVDDSQGAPAHAIAPGQYICIAVTDTGRGMGEEVIQQAFDPLFTTKPAGLATGLGLSMVFAFARQLQGYARIESEIGRGTTVKLYLPRSRAADARWALAR